NYVPAIPESPVSDGMFHNVIALSPIAVLASMIDYLFAQYVDIDIYHYWKRLTNSRYLWIRNNFSTFSSQFIDTFTVVSLMCVFGVIPWSMYFGLIVSGFCFKVFIAMLDTPFLYFFVYTLRKRFNLAIGEEIELEV